MSTWIKCSDRLPVTPKNIHDMKFYICTLKDGEVKSLMYADGWNCFVGKDGNIIKDNELKGVVAWKEENGEA